MKRFLLLWSLLAAVLVAGSLSCMYEAPILSNPPPGAAPSDTPPPETASGSGNPEQRKWVSNGLLIRTDVPGPPVGSLRILWRGSVANPTPVPPETPTPIESPPSGQWAVAISGNNAFDNLASGAEADLYKEQSAPSDLRPGVWGFSFSIWEDGCPVSVTCGQEVFGRLDPPAPGESQLTPELMVNRDGCTSTTGGSQSSVVPSPLLAGDDAIAPIRDYPIGAPPCRWTERWMAANDWAVAVDSATGKKGLTVASGSTVRRLLSWDYVPVADTVEILAKVRPGTDLAAAVCARVAGAAGSDNAYCTALRGGTQLQVGQLVAGTQNILWNGDFPYGNGYYWIRFHLEGSAIKAKAWADNASDPYLANEPGWLIENTLPAGPPPAPGRVGVSTGDGTAGPRFEWFSVGLRGLPAPKPSLPTFRIPKQKVPRLPAAQPAQRRSSGPR